MQEFSSILVDPIEHSTTLRENDLNFIIHTHADDDSGTCVVRHGCFLKNNSNSYSIAKIKIRFRFQGDSGGPVVIDSGGQDILVGVVSGGINDGHHTYADEHMNVYKFEMWIVVTKSKLARRRTLFQKIFGLN